MFEGHAFIVEAAISLGGNMKPGINVHRFANRIPLLFEGGSDVITRTAATRISWSNYRINHNADKIGVFVSMVSTKIPFKGAGKEYIGLLLALSRCFSPLIPDSGHCPSRQSCCGVCAVLKNTIHGGDEKECPLLCRGRY